MKRTAAIILLAIALIASLRAPVRADVEPHVYFDIGRTYNVVGESMLPTLTPGEMVVIDVLAQLQPGDILAYRQFGTGVLVSHRIVRTGEDQYGVWYETKGDALPVSDIFLVRPSQVVGKVRWRLTKW